jgi:cysteine synthase A
LFNEKEEMKTLDSILDVIGNTPLLTVRKIADEPSTVIKAKLESFNPTGSLKDRIYKEMISAAVKSGELRPGVEILEVSTGNAGISCTFVGGVMGYRVTVVMPEGMSEERKQLIHAYGGNTLFTPGGESDVDLCFEKARELMTKQPGKYWFPDQFSNSNNPLAHYKTTGPEIWSQANGEVDCFVAAQGSGGSLTGVGRYLREKKSDVKLYAVEPLEAPILSCGKWGTHKIEGIGDGFVPHNLDLSILDGVVTVSSTEAINMTRRLILEEGIFCGISSGCNVAAAMKIATTHHHKNLRIVTMINDSGNRYLSTEVFGTKTRKEKRVLSIPKRRHRLDTYSLEQLRKYRSKFEIIE